MSKFPDIIFITIDCWRHDAVDQMDELRSLTSEYNRTDAICQSAATPGVFPSIFASQYYPEVYDSSGSLKTSTKTLPRVLSNHGYRTGAVIADNPFLDRFSGGFEDFWNGPSGRESRLKRLYRLGRQRDVAPVSEVAKRAEDWFKSADGSRFLFVHLMDPHEPYLPGWRRGLREGLFKSYRTLQKFERDRQSLSADEEETVKKLYWHCIDYLDSQIHKLLSFVPDDAIVVIMGDHGEELKHGAYRHARLYEECVRVPILTNNLAQSRLNTTPVRQMDVSPTILDQIGIGIPDGWNGKPVEKDARDTFLINHSPHLEASYVGKRTDSGKLIYTFEGSTKNPTRIEFFDLNSDSEELENVYSQRKDSDQIERFEEDLNQFWDQSRIKDGITYGTSPDTEERQEASQPVDDRLEALGYK